MSLRTSVAVVSTGRHGTARRYQCLEGVLVLALGFLPAHQGVLHFQCTAALCVGTAHLRGGILQAFTEGVTGQERTGVGKPLTGSG